MGNVSGGQREFIPFLVRAAAGCGINALFMEVHDDVENAKSDAATQWPLQKLSELLESIKKIHQAIS